MRILIADDHDLVRDGITSILLAAGHEVIAQVGNGKQAVEESKRLHPDLVLMDISMPVMNGLEALRRIKKQNPDIPVVMLTVSDDDSDLVEAMKSGAQGYLLKNLTTDGFLESLSGLERGEYAISPHLTTRLIDGLLETPDALTKPPGNLTQREIDVLRLMAEGMSNKEIAIKLALSEHTVKYYVKKILLKLEVHNRTEAVARALRYDLFKTNSADQ